MRARRQSRPGARGIRYLCCVAIHEEHPGSTESDLEARATKASVGERLRIARRDAGMSQEAVSKRLGRGFSLASLYRWEAGVDLPSFDKMARLANLYGSSLDWLAGSTDCRQVFRAGKLVVDRDALKKIDEVADGGLSLDELPRELVRSPGLNAAWPVPKRPMMLDAAAAHSIETRLHTLYEKLRRHH